MTDAPSTREGRRKIAIECAPVHDGRDRHNSNHSGVAEAVMINLHLFACRRAPMLREWGRRQDEPVGWDVRCPVGRSDTVDILRHNGCQESRASAEAGDGATATRCRERPEEERTAIFEHDGHIPRGWEEGFARLDPDKPPGDVAPKRWQSFAQNHGVLVWGVAHPAKLHRDATGANCDGRPGRP
jgi:hypothetical protein